jgi:hypothetical protein
MDICTASMIVTMNAIACIPPTVCHTEGDRRFCQPDFFAPSSCPQRGMQSWECKREDGSTYYLERPIDFNVQSMAR